MGTSWATNCWAASSWAVGTWADLGSVTEVLGLGDLTTQFAYWLRSVAPDVTTSIRDRLAAHFGVAQPADNTVLVARFLARE